MVSDAPAIFARNCDGAAPERDRARRRRGHRAGPVGSPSPHRGTGHDAPGIPGPRTRGSGSWGVISRVKYVGRFRAGKPVGRQESRRPDTFWKSRAKEADRHRRSDRRGRLLGSSAAGRHGGGIRVRELRPRQFRFVSYPGSGVRLRDPRPTSRRASPGSNSPSTGIDLPGNRSPPIPGAGLARCT